VPLSEVVAWRAILASVVYVAGTLGLLIGTGKLVHSPDPALRAFLIALVHLVLGFILVRLFTRTLLARTLPDMGLAVTRRAPRQLAFGAGIGMLLVTVCFCIAWGAGSLQVTLGQSLSSTRFLALDAGTVAIASSFEEVMFRAGLTGALLLALPRGLAVAIPAAIFGLLHAMNPGATTLSVSNTMLAGIVLGLLYVRGRVSLLAPIGFHVAWNLMLGRVYGTAVSGHSTGKALLDAEPMDTLWSGGSYGIEAGIGTTLVLAVATLLLIATEKTPATTT
jgi:uncharacterized protein